MIPGQRPYSRRRRDQGPLAEHATAAAVNTSCGAMDQCTGGVALAEDRAGFGTSIVLRGRGVVMGGELCVVGVLPRISRERFAVLLAALVRRQRMRQKDARPQLHVRGLIRSLLRLSFTVNRAFAGWGWSRAMVARIRESHEPDELAKGSWCRYRDSASFRAIRPGK